MDCSALTCNDQHVAISAWVQMLIAVNPDNTEQNVLHAVEEAGVQDPVCRFDTHWSGLLKQAIRKNGDCYQLAVTIVEASEQTCELTVFGSWNAIVRQLMIVDADGCLSVRVAERDFDEEIQCIDQAFSLEQLLRSSLMVTDEGNLALGVVFVDNLVCTLECFLEPWQLRARQMFVRSGSGFAVLMVSGAGGVLGNFLLGEDGNPILLEDGSEIELEQ